MDQQSAGGAVDDELIKKLIILYDDSIRLQKKVLDCNFAEALLSMIPLCMESRKTLADLLEQKTKDCKRLNVGLEIIRGKISELFAQQEENTHLKKFLDFAMFLSTFLDNNDDFDVQSKSGEKNLLQFYNIQSKSKISEELNPNNTGNEQESGVGQEFNENTEASTSSKLPLNTSNEDIISKLNSKLKTTQKLLNAEKLRSERIEKEREKLDSLSDNLCCLLQKYRERLGVLVKGNETTTQTSNDGDQLNVGGKYYSDSYREKITSQPGHRNFENNSHSQHDCNLSSSHPLNFQHSNITEESINAMSKLSKTNVQSSDVTEEISGQYIQKPTFPPDELSPHQSNFHCDTSETHFRPEENINLPIREYEKKIQLFVLCLKCGKSFLTKNSEKNFVKCPVCDLNDNDLDDEDKTKLLTAALDGERNGKPEKTGDFSEQKQSEIPSWCCIICDRQYSHERDLRNHVRRTHVEKHLECAECGKRFSQKYILKRHISAHGSQKPYKCSVCNIGFKWSSNRKRHEQSIHKKGGNIGKLQCVHCGKRFLRKVFLTSHVRTKHFSRF